MEIGVFVVGEAPQSRAIAVDDEEIGEAVAEAGEHELLPVRRPLRGLQSVQADVDPALFAPALDVENDQVVAVFPLRGDGEVTAVGRERAGGIDEAQAFVIVVLRRFDEAALDATRLDVGEPEIDEEPALVAEERDGLAVGRQRWREENAAPRAALSECRLRDAAGAIVIPQLGQERRLDGVAPIVGEVLERPSRCALERRFEPGGRGGLQDLADDFVAPLLTDVSPQGVSVPVWENVGVGRHLLDRGQVPLERGVAQPHRRLGIDRTERQVLGHAFHEPQRWIDGHERLHAGAGPAAAEHIVLELVDHLVLEHVLEFGIRPGEGEHGAVLEEFRDASQPFARGVYDVGLLKVGLGRVQDDRLAALKLMVEDAREPGVGAFRHARRIERAGTLIRIVVDVEVFGLNGLEVETPVLHLVLTEILRVPTRRCGDEHQCHCRQPTTATHPALSFRACLARIPGRDDGSIAP